MNEPVKQEIKRNLDGTFLPGVSGNPDGRPKGKTLKEFAREYLANLPDEDKTAYLATLPKEIVWKMAEGNPKQDTELQVTRSMADVLDELELEHGPAPQG